MLQNSPSQSDKLIEYPHRVAVVAIRIGTNTSTLYAQRQLDQSSSTLATTYERLSSGQRINRASDDAAGLAVVAGLEASIRVATQGVRNLNDGISMLNIAGGATEALKSVVLRVRELATSAANGTLSHTQRGSLDREAQELVKEHNRIIDSTVFNGVKLFGEEAGTTYLQAGESILGVALSATTVVGSGSFQTARSFAGAPSSTSPVVADVNNDGNLDALTISTTTSQISVNLGNGNGTFGSAMLLSPGSIATTPDFKVLDTNNDGNIDIIAAVSTGFAVLRGNGDGTFGGPTYYAAQNAQAFSLVDANGDGIKDIFSGRTGASFAHVLFGNGDGTYRSPLSVASSNRVGFASVTGDFDNNGFEDVIGDTAGSVSILLSNGDGTFRNARVNTLSNNARSLSVGDINGDGALDYAATVLGSNDIAIFLGNGDGTFRLGATAVPNIVGPGDAELADINGDGRLDLVSGDNGLYTIALGNGDGTFAAAVSGSLTGGYSLAIADFDNDGVLDLFGGTNGTSVALGIATNAARTLSQRKLSNLSVADLSSTKMALGVLDRQMTFLNAISNNIGVNQSKLTTSINALQSSIIASAGAVARIRDVDVAEEASRLVSTRILQQTAAAILSHSAAEPRLALVLLGA